MNSWAYGNHYDMDIVSVFAQHRPHGEQHRIVVFIAAFVELVYDFVVRGIPRKPHTFIAGLWLVCACDFAFAAHQHQTTACQQSLHKFTP